jgi:hypothetical protein
MGRGLRLRLPPLTTIALAVLVLLGRPGVAQVDEYDTRYGATIEVSVDDLLQMPESYLGRAVRTRGELDTLPSLRGLVYALRGTFGGRLLVAPVPEATEAWEERARVWMGREVEVTGVLSATNAPVSSSSAITPDLAAYYIAIWGFLGPPDEKELAAPATPTTLEALVTKLGKLDGRNVTVVGQFRGANLFGDLPASSRRRTSDWVIKEELYAVWVTGRKPKGAGWSYDPGLKRDTGKWLRVTGRVSTQRGVVTIEAVSIALDKAPSAAAAAQPPPPPPLQPKKPPVVVFSLPLDGEREVPAGTIFKVQFSQDMDEASLKDRVILRYAGRPQPGDRALDAVKITYDGGPHAVEIDPGDLLRPGRVVEILLLPGIKDLDGLPLQARPGFRPPEPAVDVLRFRIATPGLLGGSSP